MSSSFYYVGYRPHDKASDIRILGYVSWENEAEYIVEQLRERTGDQNYYWDEILFLADFQAIIDEEAINER